MSSILSIKTLFCYVLHSLPLFRLYSKSCLPHSWTQCRDASRRTSSRPTWSPSSPSSPSTASFLRPRHNSWPWSAAWPFLILWKAWADIQDMVPVNIESTFHVFFHHGVHSWYIYKRIVSTRTSTSIFSVTYIHVVTTKRAIEVLIQFVNYHFQWNM